MPSTKEIEPYKRPTKEISLEEILRMHGVPSAEEESVPSSFIPGELLERYINKPMAARGYSPATIQSVDAGLLTMLLAAPMAGLANRMVMPEAYRALSAVPAAEEFAAGPGAVNERMTRMSAPSQTQPLGNVFGSSDATTNLGPGERGFLFPNETTFQNRGERTGSLLPHQDPIARINAEVSFGSAPPYRTDRPEIADPRPHMRRPSGSHSYEFFRRPLQEAAPVRSLPPYEEYPRYRGRHPTTENRRSRYEILRRTRDLERELGHPTGMMDKPKPLTFSAHDRGVGIGRDYTQEIAEDVPKGFRRPGLLVYQMPGHDDISVVYYGPDNQPLAAASASRMYKGKGIYVHKFGADMTRGIAGKRAAMEVGAALFRMHPAGGAMSQYSRGMMGRIAEALSNPKLREAYYKTRLLSPGDVRFPE